MKRIIEKLISTVIFIIISPLVWCCGALFGIIALMGIEIEEIKEVWKDEG